MHKIILSFAILLSALSLTAQVPGISATAAYDDFNSVTDYKSQTNDKAWDEVQNAPSNSFAFKGIIWENSTSIFGTRNGDGKISYTINQAYGKYKPINVHFGTYTNLSSVKTNYTIDLSKNANLSFSIKNVGNISKIRVYIQVRDIKDTVLVFMAGAIQNQFYNWYLGFAEGLSTPVENNNKNSNFSINLSTAVVGEGGGEYRLIVSPSGNSTFDYTKVKVVSLSIVQNEVNSNDEYKPLALVDYPVEISNFRLGDVSSVVTDISKEEKITEITEDVSVYDSMGKFIAIGKLNSLELESGKLYIVKSGSKSRKIIMN